MTTVNIGRCSKFEVIQELTEFRKSQRVMECRNVKRDLLNRIRNNRVPLNVGNILTKRATISFSPSVILYGISVIFLRMGKSKYSKNKSQQQH